MRGIMNSEKKKFVKDLESEKKRLAEKLENEKKKFSEEYKKAVMRYQQDNLVLDDAFVNKFFNEGYNKLYALRQKIEEYNQGVSRYTADLSDRRGADSLGEGILCLKAYIAGSNSSTMILYISDAIALLTKSKEQYGDMEKFDGMLRVAIGNMTNYINDLNSVMVATKSSLYASTYLDLKDKIREAKEILEKLRVEIKEKYELARNKRKETKQPF
jgi:hypothetical protein